MKNSNLLNRLLSYSHEKQKMGGMRRYAAMLMMLLTLGVGQMWARTYDGTEKLYIKNIKPGSWGSHWISGTGQVLWVQFDGNSSTNTAATYISGSGTLYSDSYYELTVPSGTYTNIVIYRGASLGSSWNNTGSISLNSTANVIDGGYSEGGTVATWNTFLEVTTSTVLYFKIGSWWYNSGCNHYIEFYTIDGSTQTLPAYDLASYLSNNATTSTTSSTSNDKIFVTLPTGVYKSYKLDRKKSDSASGENHNQSSECSFSSSTGKNQVGTMTNGGAISTWDTYKPTSTCGLDADETEVTLNTAVTLTPSLSSNTLLNTYKSVSYSVNTGTSGTHWTIDGNTFTPLVAGTYTITANITYYAKGFPDLTTTTSAGSTSPTVTVTATAPDTYYDVTFGVGTDYSSYGDLTARNTTDGVDLTSVASVLAGKAITFTASPSQTYYEVEGFYSNEDCTVSLQSGNTTTYTVASLTSDLDVYVKFKLKNFTVTYYNMTGATNDPSNPSSVTYETATVTLGDPEKTGYRFDGWYDNSSFTGSKVTTIPTHTTANVSLWAKWNENLYTITLVNATDDEVTAGCATRPTITAAAAPFGMTFDHWDVSGGASVANDHLSSTTVSATAAGTVTAVYAQNLYAYVEGRFHIASPSNHSSWTNSFTEGNWGSTCTNIQFSYDEANHRFYLHTYATPKELSTKIDDEDPYFFIRTSTSNSSVTGGNSYDPSPNTSNVELNKGVKQALQTSSHTYHLLFNSDDNTHYVTLYFDGTDIWYEYMPAIINTINLSGTRVPPMAEITATPSMYCKGATDKAYCWAVYIDEECTSPVNVSFNSLGAGKVQFTVPQTIGTYYLKLTVRASDACNASIDDEEVQSFQVTTSNMVFFNNSATQWSGVYVYFLGDTKYWSDENKGSGCEGRDYGRANQMHRIGKSDIYFYEYSGNALGVNAVQFIAFTEYGKPNATDFAYVNAAYRGDFARGCAPMYVPENWVTDRLNYCEYYNRGYWTTYGINGVARSAGFTLKIFDSYDGGSQVGEDHPLSNIDGSDTYRTTVHLDNVDYSYGFQLYSCGNIYYGNDGVINANVSNDWKFEPDKHRCGLDSKAAGDYTFIVQCTDGGEVRVRVEYPLLNGDYRLVYNDTCSYQTGPHPSQFIRQNYSAVDVKLDTVSMYIRPDKQPVLTIQRCTNASTAPPTWANVGTYDVTGLTNGHGVYNFYISQAVSSGALTINSSSPYTGLYYIRTQSVDGGWISYESNKDNVMTYTEYAEQENIGFNYYKAKWIGATGADVTFTIANDYSESLCDTMVADPGNNPLNEEEARSLPHTASVRFGWNSKTNTLHRAYINGSSNVSDRYLVMIGDTKLKDKDGKALNIEGLNANEISFTDLNNWIYRCDVTAVEGAAVKLTANYDSHVQYFIGDEDETEEIIGGSGDDPYVLRVTYDFKTNRLMTAWLPSGSRITDDVELNADMMLIREGQNAATQVYFNGSGKSIQDIHTIYGVMQFNYSDIVGKFSSWSSPNAYKFLMYYVSFPFDVKVSEIFGCGVRGTNWIIQKYNGAKRAQIGWFAETSTFWETLPGDSTLNANEGYLLILDRISFNDGGSKIWENLKSGNSVYLYFPSTSATSGTISESTATIHVPEHTCTINRSFNVDGIGSVNHKNTDSHWNVIGTPLFENKTASNVVDGPTIADEEKFQYFYRWDYSDNSIDVEGLCDTTTFMAMHSYMVQYTGDITFTGAKLTPPPASVAARHMPSDKKNYRVELRMVNEDNKVSRTYVELRENACDTFALNEDMYMMRSSSKADLYTFAGNYDVAANVLSMNNHIVPVGMNVKRAGTYRFTMPSEFSGTVTLIDTETGVRTNLALSDYEVALPNGTSNTRFLLEIDIQQMPTAIDGVGGSLKDGKAHKFIQNGQMYILQNGIIYDARGNRVK